MASLLNAVLCAVVATVFWSVIGYALARPMLPRTLALGAAPVLGWAVYSAATLPIFFRLGFTPAVVISIAVVCVAAAAGSLVWLPIKHDAADAPKVPVCTYAAAAALALAPAVAILPKFSRGAVYLADPIFDHSKIAIIDAMVRQGLPPVDPVFAGPGGSGGLAYYYLWHFSAAQLALPFGVSGWEADIGLTWFTAFASLSLMMALAVWLSRRPVAAIWVIALAAATSLRAAFDWLFGSYDLTPFLRYPTGFAGWLFQAAWVPQHLMAASCVLLAMLLIALYALRPSLLVLASLVLTVAAGFESSTYVGGVTFALAAVAAAPFFLFFSAAIEPGRRLRFAAAMTGAALLVACLAAPFIIDQVAMTAARHDPTPIVIRPFPVLGDLFPERLRRILDLPAYWLIELPIEFPATFVSGVIALWLLWRGAIERQVKIVVAGLACLAGAGLAASWLLASTLGDNNDLALRAVLPAAMVLIVATAVGIVALPRRSLITVVALAGLVLSLPDTAKMIRLNVGGHRVPDGKIFAQTPELWAAVRRYAGITARVANNPLYLKGLTLWPANISWALLADRNSCFAGRELALAFAPLPAARREAINQQFVQVFAGQGSPDDVHDLAGLYGCDVIVLVPQDGAWANDPFAASPDYRLAEARAGRWKIYVRAAVARSDR
jgi:hypothetical protein